MKPSDCKGLFCWETSDHILSKVCTLWTMLPPPTSFPGKRPDQQSPEQHELVEQSLADLWLSNSTHADGCTLIWLPLHTHCGWHGHHGSHQQWLQPSHGLPNRRHGHTAYRARPLRRHSRHQQYSKLQCPLAEPESVQQGGWHVRPGLSVLR